MKQLLIFLALPVLMLVAGCNDDVFLDEPDMSDEIEYTIEGDGGEATFEIPTKGLEHVSFDMMSSSEPYCTYYNAACDVIDRNSPVSEVSRIVYDNDFLKFELRRQGKTLTVKSICNTFHMEIRWDVRLDYGKYARLISIIALPGKPMKLTEVAYSVDGLKIDDIEKVKTKRLGFHNAGPLPQTVEIMPYLEERYSILLEPDDDSSWSRGEQLNIEVPVFENDSWQMKKTGITVGYSSTYSKKEYLMKVNVDVPAYSNVNIFTDVIYSKAQTRGCMTFLNEVLNREILVFFTVTSTFPTSYKIRTEDAK